MRTDSRLGRTETRLVRTDTRKGRTDTKLGRADTRLVRMDIIVNTNSKYKEDDFTDSIAVAYSQDVFIYFLHEAPTCQTPSHSFPPLPSTHPSPQSG